MLQKVQAIFSASKINSKVMSAIPEEIGDADEDVDLQEAVAVGVGDFFEEEDYDTLSMTLIQRWWRRHKKAEKEKGRGDEDEDDEENDSDGFAERAAPQSPSKFSQGGGVNEALAVAISNDSGAASPTTPMMSPIRSARQHAVKAPSSGAKRPAAWDSRLHVENSNSGAREESSAGTHLSPLSTMNHDSDTKQVEIDDETCEFVIEASATHFRNSSHSEPDGEGNNSSTCPQVASAQIATAGRQNAKRKKRKRKWDCVHGVQKSKCKKCLGDIAKTCTHGRKRVYCKECDGRAICCSCGRPPERSRDERIAYYNIVALACGHTYCKKCLQKYWKDNPGNGACPNKGCFGFAKRK